MEFLILLGIVSLLGGPVGLVLAILAYRRAGRLERQLRRMQAAGQAPAAGTEVSAPGSHSQRGSVRPAPPVETERTAAGRPGSPARPSPLPRVRPAPPSKKKAARTTDIEAILGGQWLTWAGILALFFGSAFFLGVDLGASSLSGLPQVLIGLGVAVGFGFLGHRLSSRAERFLGLGLLGGSVALLFLGMFAAYGFHRLVPLPVVFPLLLGVACIGAWLALNRDSLTIASLTLVGAFLTPVILIGLARENSTFDALLPYLVAVNLGSVLVGLRRGWAGLPLGAFLSTLILVTNWWGQHARQDLFVFLSVAGSWLVFAVAPWLQRAGNRFWSLARAGVLAANGLAFALFCHQQFAAAGKPAQGGVLAGLAIVYFVMSGLMKARRGENEATRLSHSTGAALAVLAVPVLLDLAWVTLGWTVLAAILIIAGLREHDPWQRGTGLVVLMVGIFRVIALDIPTSRSSLAGFQPLWNGEFLAGLAALALMGWTFWAYHRYEDRLSTREKRGRSAFLVLTVLILLWKLSLELAGYFEWRERLQSTPSNPDLGLWLMMLWTIYGLATLLVGLRTRHRALRGSGYAVLGLAVVGTLNLALEWGVDLVQNYVPVFNLPFIQGVLLAAALGVVAWRLNRSGPHLGAREFRLRTPVLMAAILAFFLKVSFEVMAFFQLGDVVAAANLALKSQLTLSVVWGIYAGVVIWVGFSRRFKPIRLLGMSLLGVTVFKVFVLDMQSLARGYRIAAFVALGILLLAVSLLYQRERKSRAEDTE